MVLGQVLRLEMIPTQMIKMAEAQIVPILKMDGYAKEDLQSLKTNANTEKQVMCLTRMKMNEFQETFLCGYTYLHMHMF